MLVHTTAAAPNRARVFRPQPSPELDRFQRSRVVHDRTGALLGGVAGACVGLASQTHPVMTLVAAGGIVIGGSLLYAVTASSTRNPRIGMVAVGASVALLAGLTLTGGAPLHPALGVAGGAIGALAGWGMGRACVNRIFDPYGTLRREEATLGEQQRDFDRRVSESGGALQEAGGRVIVGGVPLPKR
ncbi:MAG: hypothetical protein AB1758_23620 [Candidatus Eremiobacterota bacterium]